LKLAAAMVVIITGLLLLPYSSFAGIALLCVGAALHRRSTQRDELNLVGALAIAAGVFAASQYVQFLMQ
jgi:uncharacterized membrane protein YgaE (UPF0421/DUF939 family)